STGSPRTPTAGCSATCCGGRGGSTGPSSRTGRASASSPVVTGWPPTPPTRRARGRRAPWASGPPGGGRVATSSSRGKRGRVPGAAIDDAVWRLLSEKFELGLFEDPYVDPARADEISGSAESRGLALEAARQAIVLLQNRGGLLPLSAGRARRVAVIGPHAAE